MSLAVAPPAACYAPADDRSLSGEGSTLRESLEAAMAPPHDRGEEIYLRVATALEKAQRQEGILILPETFGHALEFLQKLPREVPLPEVIVESENEIGMDWDEGRNRVLSLTVRDTPLIGFAGLFGAEPVHGRVVLGEEIPDTLRFFFAKLYPSVRSRRP